MAKNKFAHLEVALWRQFDTVSIDFHPRLTVITGANGAGKSTLISLLAQHFGWSRPFLNVPTKSKEGVLSYGSGLITDFFKRFIFRKEQPNAIGFIDYTEAPRCTLLVAETQNWQTGFRFSSLAPIDGLLIDSHRPNPFYTQVGQIPLQPMTAQASFDNYNSELVNRYNGHHTNSSPIYRMKESIISMAIFGEGNVSLGGSNPSLLKTFDGFNAVLRNLLPSSLGFKSIAIRSPEVVLITESGEFMLDASSGGIMTLIDVAWRIYMFAHDKENFVVLMDEPENHLHPSMQRTLMRRLLSAFPNAQFIVATHSPFMVTSVRDSTVVALKYKSVDREDGISADVSLPIHRRVVSQTLSLTNKAAGAADVLREVLGVPATMPEWVEEELERVVDKFRGKEISSRLLDELRSDLVELGFDDYYSQALGDLAQKS